MSRICPLHPVGTFSPLTCDAWHMASKKKAPKPKAAESEVDYSKDYQLSIRFKGEFIRRVDAIIDAVDFGLDRVTVIRECALRGIEQAEARFLGKK